MRSRLIRTVAFVTAVVVVIPMLLVLMGNDFVALIVFVAMPVIAIASAFVLVRAARRGQSIPLLSYIAAMLVVLAIGSTIIAVLAIITLLRLEIDEALGDVLLFGTVLAVTGVPGPAFLLFYRQNYFDGGSA